MRIDIVFPRLPPVLDGIGDHTACLAETLAAQACTPRVLTAQSDWRPLSGVTVEKAFHRDDRRGVLRLVDAVSAHPPDWLLLQFEQFSYGRWGLNPFLPLAIYRIRRKTPATRIAILFHEDYMPATGPASAVMSAWQQPQFRVLGHLADIAFFSTEQRAKTYAGSFNGTNVRHLPVGSNMPTVSADRLRQRTALGIDDDTVVLGVFGSAHPSRLLSHVGAAVTACRRESTDVDVLYIGPDGDDVRSALGAEADVLDAGPLAPEEVSRHFCAMDLYLAPFRDGVSSRRGSFLTGLQHGVATATTRGPETGPSLARQHGTAFVAPPRDRRDLFVRHVTRLASSPALRTTLGEQGHALYDRRYAWPHVARRLRTALRRTARAPRAGSCS
jgi:glycosyltransferase involved in cell wall biosynthesis